MIRNIGESPLTRRLDRNKGHNVQETVRAQALSRKEGVPKVCDLFHTDRGPVARVSWDSAKAFSGKQLLLTMMPLVQLTTNDTGVYEGVGIGLQGHVLGYVIETLTGKSILLSGDDRAKASQAFDEAVQTLTDGGKIESPFTIAYNERINSTFDLISKKYGGALRV